MFEVKWSSFRNVVRLQARVNRHNWGLPLNYSLTYWVDKCVVNRYRHPVWSLLQWVSRVPSGERIWLYQPFEVPIFSRSSHNQPLWTVLGSYITFSGCSVFRSNLSPNPPRSKPYSSSECRFRFRVCSQHLAHSLVAVNVVGCFKGTCRLETTWLERIMSTIDRLD
jgi:hypothetical protein